MEFLLNPDFAYVLLVLGSVLALMGILTPGTGLIEVGAMFCLVLAGYAAYRLGFNLWALILLILMFFPFIYAIRKPGRVIYLFVSVILLIVGSMYLFPSQGLIPAVNPWLVIVVSGLVVAFTWLVINKSISALHARPQHDINRLIGMSGEAKTSVDITGSVQVDGELWTARSENHIPQGSQVRVTGREGFTLLVELDGQNSKGLTQ